MISIYLVQRISQYLVFPNTFSANEHDKDLPLLREEVGGGGEREILQI